VEIGVIYLVKLIAKERNGENKQETALEILKKRYAKGEINKEEFEKIKNDLSYFSQFLHDFFIIKKYTNV
jgi:putative membrane protein